jgi:hypothetical protein
VHGRADRLFYSTKITEKPEATPAFWVLPPGSTSRPLGCTCGLGVTPLVAQHGDFHRARAKGLQTEVTYGDPRIDVVAPSLVAVTLPTRFEGTNPDEKHFDVRNMYSVVLAERDGHRRIIQEHASTVRPPEK